MADLNETPSSNRLQIGFFGKTNAGKSSLMNAFSRQEISLVSEVAGTTTDPVKKAMEIHPLGACNLIDTAGYFDETELGKLREEKTRKIAEGIDLAILVISAEEEYEDWQTFERSFTIWHELFRKLQTPVLAAVTKCDLDRERALKIAEAVRGSIEAPVCLVSAKTREGLEEMKEQLVRLIPKDFGEELITGGLVSKEDVVLLVMPQDIQAPKGRLILPQVQTIRELLDLHCIVVSTTCEEYEQALFALKKAPKLIITDSQVFAAVNEKKPKESMLTSFSVLMAAYKGDFPYFKESVKAIASLTEQSRVLIAECCTHAPLTEDIGTVKIPGMLRKRVGEGLKIDHVSGVDFPDDLSAYDLIIQCGACMFHKKYVMSRVERAKKAAVPMTNYGVVIAYLTGILENVTV